MDQRSASVLLRLRMAAREAAEAMVEYGGQDPAELVALAQHIGARENASVECTEDAGSPGVLSIRFSRTVGASS